MHNVSIHINKKTLFSLRLRKVSSYYKYQVHRFCLDNYWLVCSGLEQIFLQCLFLHSLWIDVLQHPAGNFCAKKKTTDWETWENMSFFCDRIMISCREKFDVARINCLFFHLVWINVLEYAIGKFCSRNACYNVNTGNI